MQRRRLIALTAALSLGGCGFKLRGAPDLAFRSIYINASDNSPLVREIRSNLSSLGSLQLIDDASQQASAEVILDILDEAREKTVVGVTASGQAREFQLRAHMRFRLRTPQGKELIGATNLRQQRDISFNESSVLAKEAEADLLFRDMQTDIVQQLLRSLAAVRTL